MSSGRSFTTYGGMARQLHYKRRVSKCLLGLSGLLAGCVGLEPGETRGEIQGGESDACFTVQTPDATHTVRGSLVSNGDFDRAVLLLHGAAGSRDAWMGISGSSGSAPDAASALASRGYGVFVVDRLGYGESPFGASGFAMTIDLQVEATHQIVQQIKAGTYGCDSAPATAASGVFVGGQSLGALIVELYATRHDDEVEGIISTGISTFGPGLTLANVFGTHILPQILAGNDYVTLFPYGADGFSQECEDLFFYPPGSNAGVIDAVCSEDAPGTIVDGLTPIGDILSGFAAEAEIQANTGNVEAPVLFVLADRDAVTPGAAGGPSGTEQDKQAAEAALWRDNCNCEVTTTQSGNRAGHLWQFHHQGNALLGQMADWLDSH